MRALFLIFAALFVTACSTAPTQQSDQTPHGVESAAEATAQVKSYCDRYLIYDMCAVDVDDNGSTDALYFDDTKEIFMYDTALPVDAYSLLPMHACVQQMDEEMKQASNRILTVTEETSVLERISIKKGLMMNYMRYYGRVRECREQIAASAPAVEAFGDPHDQEFF